MDVDDARPIWVQLAAEFRRRIAVGTWVPGARIPSVRELALELGVNPNTVQRALAETDREGLTLTERTAGRFVTDDIDTIAGARRDLAGAATDAYVESVRGLGLDLGQVTELLARRWVGRKEQQ